MSYTAIHTVPDENVHIRSRFHKLVSAMFYYGVHVYTKSVYCLWWDVTFYIGGRGDCYPAILQPDKDDVPLWEY